MNSQEKRSSPRLQVNERIELTDLNSNQPLGNLVNISVSGFMLLTDRSLSPNRLFQLRMQLPTPIEYVESIDFGAECLWCQEVPDSDHCWAGFQIIDISEQNSRLIQSLIGSWAD